MEKLAVALAVPPATLVDALTATKPACAESFAAAEPPKAALDAKAPTINDVTMSRFTDGKYPTLSI